MRKKYQPKIKRYGTFRLRFALLALVSSVGLLPRFMVRAEGCLDVRIVFVRGSGGERWVDKNYLEFKATIEEKLKTIDLSYEFIDLDYPAVGVGINNLGVMLGAFFGAGEAYEFGKSVKTGINNLVKLVNNSACPNTKYVLGGYSQGAMVISKALPSLNESKIIYAATFGDPKIYLPEGAGPVPVACSGRGLSEYRMYVPDCQAYQGLLGAYKPYRPESLKGRVGTWCNKKDVFCSSRLSISDHSAYVEDELYHDAAKVIFDKICKSFGVKNKITSPHDTVIMLDSTDSMMSLIDSYKTEAKRLARETFESGGRIALYDYRDLNDPYEPVEHCNFDTCTMEVFEKAIDSIRVGGGGDWGESLLSAAFHAMKSLKWKFGSTKSMIVLTDAPFLLPDRDGVTLDEVIRLSKEIDPVNFYVVADSWLGQFYTELVDRTDGMHFSNFKNFGLLTEHIMSRYDSLPRVEENYSDELPTLEILESSFSESGEATVRFKSSSGRAMIVLNDAILGITKESEITISEISRDAELLLVPLTNDLRGEGVSVSFGATGFGGGFTLNEAPSFIPKAPNTGRR